MSRQFSSHQEHYPSRGGGTLGADRKAATALVYQDVVAGVASTVAIQGDDGSVIAIQASALNTDNVIFNAATVYVAALGGGMIYVEESDYNLAATWNVSVDIFVQGAGWDAILNYNAGGNCITATGDNVKIRDLKIIIVAGAGGAGTRPNGIFADTRINVEIFGVWVIGDTTVADDGSNIRQCGIVFDTVTESKISSNRFEDNERHGLSLNDASNDNVISLNNIQGNTSQGCRFSESDNNVFSNNVSTGNLGSGLTFDSSDENIISNNISNRNGVRGISTNIVDKNTFIGNVCVGNTFSGMLLQTSDDNVINGNFFNGNVTNGLFLTASVNNIISNNQCNDNDTGTTNSFSGILIQNNSNDNMVHSNTCNNNDRFGIAIFEANCSDNWVKNNQLQGNTSGPIQENGTDTKLATYPMPFIQGTTFISADGSAKGWEINAEADMAVALGQLPLEVQQVVRIKIWAVALGAPAGAGGQMHLDIIFNAGASLEAWNLAANSWTLANFDGEETDYVNTNVIHWVIEDGDVGTELSNLLGGDSLELKVNGGTAVAPDGATNATFRVIEIEYV